MAVNVKLLKKVRKLIAEEPRRLDMDTWGIRRDKEAVDDSDGYLPPCGTVCCLAGWIVLAGEPKSKWSSMFDDGDLVVRGKVSNVPRKAAKLVGISYENAPFWNITWGAKDVIAWIDRQIDAAK